MRLSLRFIMPLVIALGIMAYGIVPLVDTLIFDRFTQDIDIRTKLIANTMQDSLIQSLERPSNTKIQNLFSRVIQDERLYALALCDEKNQVLYKTQTFPDGISCKRSTGEPQTRIVKHPQGSLHVAFHPIEDSGRTYGQLVLVHDMSFLQKRSSDTKTYIVYLFTVLGAVISFITVIIAQLSWRGWVTGIRGILKGEGLVRPLSQVTSPEFRPIVKDLRVLIKDLEADRRTRDENQISWNPRALKDILNKELSGDEVLIVSNREPYIHVRRNEKIEIQVPASGLVTALEPIMRACSGTWIAHGSGNADRDVVDSKDHVKVPPDVRFPPCCATQFPESCASQFP